MHSVGNSATGVDARRAETTRRIVACAQDLCLERGFSGFTLDELAEAAGVSRRTLFNYVGDKEHAVLGPAPCIPAEQIEAFRAGGPTGDLLADIVTLLDSDLVTQQDAADGFDRVSRLLLARPELVPRFAAHAERMLDEVREHILARPGETSVRADVAIGVVLVQLKVAVRTSLRDGTSFAAALAQARDALTDLAQPQHP